MRKNKGFTLIELLVVLLILGIVSGALIYALGDWGASRKAKMSAEQFISYVKLVQQRALLETRTLGINVDNAGFETYRLVQGAQWVSLPKNRFFNRHSFPKQVLVHLKSPRGNHSKRPDIVINPSGDMTPFILSFDTADQHVIHVTGLDNGEMQLTP